jgi:hypothetical protein
MNAEAMWGGLAKPAADCRNRPAAATWKRSSAVVDVCSLPRCGQPILRFRTLRALRRVFGRGTRLAESWRHGRKPRANHAEAMWGGLAKPAADCQNRPAATTRIPGANGYRLRLPLCGQPGAANPAFSNSSGLARSLRTRHAPAESWRHGRKPSRSRADPLVRGWPPGQPSEVRRTFRTHARFHPYWWAAGPCGTARIGRLTLRGPPGPQPMPSSVLRRGPPMLQRPLPIRSNR